MQNGGLMEVTLNTVLKRRIAGLERIWPRRRSLADVERDARNIVRLTGTTYASAFEALIVDSSEDELHQMLAEAKAARAHLSTTGNRRGGRRVPT